MNELIKQLKENEKPFGRMSKEMQEKARGIGKNNFELWLGGIWGDCVDDVGSDDWRTDLTYRLSPDYKEESEVVKFEIYIGNGPDGTKVLCYDLGKSKSWRIETAIKHPDFIGFLYEDGKVRPTARYYGGKFSNLYSEFPIEDVGHMTILTPTHVLFKATK